MFIQFITFFRIQGLFLLEVQIQVSVGKSEKIMESSALIVVQKKFRKKMKKRVSKIICAIFSRSEIQHHL